MSMLKTSRKLLAFMTSAIIGWMIVLSFVGIDEQDIKDAVQKEIEKSKEIKSDTLESDTITIEIL